MSILKNEPIYPFKEGDYTKPSHIIVEGTNEEIGFALGTLAKNEYGTKLGIYDDAIYAEARREYLTQNYPVMLERSQGVLRAFGLPADDVVHDGTKLPYDFYGDTRGAKDLGATLSFCSAVVLPHEQTDTGAPYVSRNFDWLPLVLWSEVLGQKIPDGAFNSLARSFVLEIRPEQGYKTILVGGHGLLHPVGDGLNEKGLYVTQLADPGAITTLGMPLSGGPNSGLSVFQAMGMVLNTCATVEEAKIAILRNHVAEVVVGLHLLIADVSGAVTGFEIDHDTQSYRFTDRRVNEPFLCTNHPVHLYPTPDTYPEIDMSREHNTFTRQVLLRDKFATLEAPYKREDATALTDVVHCAFADDKKAEAAPRERTLYNINADLSKPEISVRFYLGDVGPIAGTNHMEDRMSDFYTYSFF